MAQLTNQDTIDTSLHTFHDQPPTAAAPAALAAPGGTGSWIGGSSGGISGSSRFGPAAGAGGLLERRTGQGQGLANQDTIDYSMLLQVSAGCGPALCLCHAV